MAKILVIDNDGIVRDALSVFLSRKGHEVLLAEDGASGLRIFKTSKPAVVILDRNMPNMTGSEVFAEIKKIAPQIPIIILTAYDYGKDAERYLKDGAAAFLSKGDGLSLVISEVDRILGAEQMEPLTERKNKVKVLVIDDEEFMAKMLVRFLSTRGYDPLMALDGKSGIALYKRHKPVLVLLDISMPDKDGLEVMEEIKTFDADAIIVMVTGNNDIEIGRQCLEGGAADYISKPINLAVLERTVKTLIFMCKSL